MENAEHEHERHVRIHIDETPHDSPTPTTGAALYVLGKIEAGLELFREVTGDREDPEVPNGPEAIHLTEDEHFHSGKPKTYTIYVNGQPKTLTTKTVTFEEIVGLAFPNSPVGQNMLYTVGYEDGPHHNPSGTLTPGQTVRIKDGMILPCSHPLISRSWDSESSITKATKWRLKSGFLLVKGVPYANSRREVRRGSLSRSWLSPVTGQHGPIITQSSLRGRVSLPR